MKKITTKNCKVFSIVICFLFTQLFNAQTTANYTYTIGAAGTVSFTNLSSSTATNMCCALWTFYDSPVVPTQVSTNNPVHTFTSNGSYIARLSVADQFNNADSIQSIITITNTACATTASLSFFNSSPTNWIVGLWGTGNIVTATWNWGDNSPNSIGLTPSHTYSTAGNYSVCVSFTNSCGASTTICHSQFFSKGENNLMLNVNVVSLNDAQNNVTTGVYDLKPSENNLKVSLYPNPTSNEFKINLKDFNFKCADLSLFDNTGKLLFTEPLISPSQNYSYTYKCTDLPNGIYLFKLKLDNDIYFNKLIINH